MKNTTTKIATMLVGLSLILSSCLNDSTVVPSPNVTTQERFIFDYDGVEISSAFIVDIEYSLAEESITIEAKDNLHQYIEVEKVNNKLRIKIRDNINISGNSIFKAHIISKNYLTSISASEASRINLINSQEPAEINIYLTGASFLTGTITTNSLTAFIDGASNVTLSGSIETFTLNSDGVSLLGSFNMEIENALLYLSGASNASLTINNTIDLTASGASVLMYKGSPQINNLELSGASQIVKAD